MVDRNLNETFRSAKYVTREGMEVYIPPSGFDWRSIQSFPAVIDPFGESTTQEFPLGTKLVYGEQVFRYALAGIAIEVGALCQAVVPLAGHIAEALGINAIGDTVVSFTPNTVTTDDLTANELQDGYFYVYDSTGEAQKMRILSHPAITGAVAGNLTLIDPFRLATVAGSTGTVIHNKFRAVIITPGPITAVPVGWTTGAVTAAYYFWLLTKGPGACLIDSTAQAVKIGQPCTPSHEDDGAVQKYEPARATEADYGQIGWIKQIGADATGGAATYGQVHAQLE